MLITITVDKIRTLTDPKDIKKKLHELFEHTVDNKKEFHEWKVVCTHLLYLLAEHSDKMDNYHKWNAHYIYHKEKCNQSLNVN